MLDCDFISLVLSFSEEAESILDKDWLMLSFITPFTLQFPDGQATPSAR